MDSLNLKRALAEATAAARDAGTVIRKNLVTTKKVNSATQHDIKLELDVRCQKLIERKLRRAFPAISLLGEEGSAGREESDHRWVVDPIDGTVNFTYGIPHACVSIALQRKVSSPHKRARQRRIQSSSATYETILGVIHDPFADELWTAVRGQPARHNGRVIRVSNRKKLSECIVSIGFAKSEETLRMMLPFFNRVVPHIRKLRMMGSAALGLAYIASGRFDGYIEAGISLWDVAAGGLLIECAGGEFILHPITGKEHAYRMVATNGLIRRELEKHGLFRGASN